VASATKRRYPHGARACVLERLPQALARLVSDRPLLRDISDRACLVPPDQQEETGNRLRQQLVDEVSREPVEGEAKGRGYEYAKNAYIPVDDDELDALAIESKHTIEIDSFIPREQIDERYLDSPYYITPDGQVGQDAFAVIREAIRGKGMVALGRVVLAKRERVIMLQPWDKGLMANCQCCRFSDLLSMTPYLAALARRRIIIYRPDRPSSIVAPNRNH
jgi:Ku70/Ku80 beta-barrel domain